MHDHGSLHSVPQAVRKDFQQPAAVLRSLPSRLEAPVYVPLHASYQGEAMAGEEQVTKARCNQCRRWFTKTRKRRKLCSDVCQQDWRRAYRRTYMREYRAGQRRRTGLWHAVQAARAADERLLALFCAGRSRGEKGSRDLF